MIVAKHENILLTIDSGGNLDKIELKEVIRFRPIDSGTERTRYLLPSNCLETMDARAYEGIDVG